MDSNSSSNNNMLRNLELEGGGGDGEEGNNNNNNNNHHHHQERRSRWCFQEWMEVQSQDLSQLLESLHKPNPSEEEEIKPLLSDCISHFKDYISTRTRLALQDASPFFAPTWCTSLENSLLWNAGCRPSIFIRLLYALTGSHLESRLQNLLHHGHGTGTLLHHVGDQDMDLSPAQMTRLNALHMGTIREEERLTGEMASHQEGLADQPIAVIANESEIVGEPNVEAEQALEDHERAMQRIMEKADRLRLRTLEEVVEILKPLQAVQFLVAGKKLHLSLHQWGKHRDEQHGRSRNNNNNND